MDALLVPEMPLLLLYSSLCFQMRLAIADLTELLLVYLLFPVGGDGQFFRYEKRLTLFCRGRLPQSSSCRRIGL